MRYCRALLILSALIAGFIAAAFAVRMPMLAAIVAVIALTMAGRKGLGLTAFGTARWANADELERAGMLSDRPGLILGHITRLRPRFFTALKGLFDRGIPSWDACERFVLSMRKLQPSASPAEVRLSNAVHTAVFAPTGVGKGVSCVIPHLLNCPDSMVVADFKGENAQLTAKHRREKFGHRTVILLTPA
jgi:type IV secretion system protein VirD4